MDYLTLAGEVHAELEVKRSRFLATVRRVADEPAALELVAEHRRLHHGARHSCSAFVLGPGQALVRASDDGEPSGTAGVPMLNVLTGMGLSDVAAVVTRYFGGTLLGAGGLARAYSGAVSKALEDAALVRRRLQELFRLSVDPGQAGQLESALRGRGITVAEVRYAATEVLLTVAVQPDAAGSVRQLVGSLTSGGTVLEPAGQAWVDQPL
ncbi:IMPACT family protein [Jatrophihabitans sp.]|uniref:IMPACT family protein n=1 Tax=Jatrophihabitans sp. TaxID=1932789 RepID=UPI002C34CF66|nr:YigZ family protein [Jatrophihabitans sp.]